MMDDHNSNDSEDQKVVKLANSIVDAENSNVPFLIIQLKELMDRYPKNSEDLNMFMKTVWKYDLLSWCAVALKYDFTKIRNGMEVAVSIVYVLCECSCSLNINDSQEFSQSTMPDAVQCILHLLRTFQKRMADSKKRPPMQSKPDQSLVNDLFMYLKSIISVYPNLSLTIFNSNDLLRIIMDDGRLFSLSAIDIAQTILRVNRSCMAQVALGNLQALLDEFVYTLTASEDEEVAAATTRLLISMCNAYDDIITIMVNRFKGLKAVLSRWKERGFERDLNRLLSLLEDGSEKSALLAKKKDAARVIWAFYMGWKTRKCMRSLHRTLPGLQRSIRKQQIEKHEAEALEKTIRLHEGDLKVEKRRAIRRTREKQLYSLEIVPANKVTNFIQSEEHKAATTIQAHWRAFTQRKFFNARREFQKRVTAAVTIQRALRKFMKSKTSLVSSATVERKTLSAEDRARFGKEIKKWQTLNKRTGVPRDDAERIQTDVHNRLLSYYIGRTAVAKEDQKSKALLARINTEQQTLSHLPPLDGATPEMIDRLACNSAVIQRVAAIEHKKELKQLTMKWWKRYIVEDDELAREGW